MKKYIIVIEKGANNLSAFCPDVPGCVSTGKTVEETTANMKEALEFHLEDEETLPEAHDMKELADAGHFVDIAEECFVARIEVSIPQSV